MTDARHSGRTRALTAGLAALLCAGAALRLHAVYTDPLLSWDEDAAAFVFPAAIGLGAAIYIVGTAVRGRAGLVIRWFGWVPVVVALAVPSTLTLALPAALVLAATLRPPRPPDAQPP